jgi:hypothetical protein
MWWYIFERTEMKVKFVVCAGTKAIYLSIIVGSVAATGGRAVTLTSRCFPMKS